MSRIGKLPINVPSGVDVKVDGRKVVVKGPKGQLERNLHDSVELAMESGAIHVKMKESGREWTKFQGLSRTLVNNMVVGVSQGFTKSLTLVGVGYRAQASGKGITLNLGYSHPIEFPPPAGIDIKVDKNTIVVVSGANKEMVGEVAAKIRSFRPPEPYHGKGVRYSDERIATKVGKAAGKK